MPNPSPKPNRKMSEITTSFFNSARVRENSTLQNFAVVPRVRIHVDDTMRKWIEATLAGKRPNIDRVGVSYMPQGEASADQNDLSVKTPPKGKDWYHVGPHVMLVLPDNDKGCAQIPEPRHINERTLRDSLEVIVSTPGHSNRSASP